MEEERVIREEGEKNQNNFKNGQLRESKYEKKMEKKKTKCRKIKERMAKPLLFLS